MGALVIGLCWGLAILEMILFIVYVCVSNKRTRRKIISMGRLIPTMQMVVMTGGIATAQTAQLLPQQQQGLLTSSQQNIQLQFGQQPSAPPPDLTPLRSQDNPPPYSSVK